MPILAWKVSPVSAKALDTFDTQIKAIIIIKFIIKHRNGEGIKKRFGLSNKRTVFATDP